MEDFERLKEAKLAELGLVANGIMHERPFDDEVEAILIEKWNTFEDAIFSLVRRERIVHLGYPIIYFRSFAYYSGNTSRFGERAVALEFKDEDEKKPIVVRFSTELNRCGLLDDAGRLPESYQNMIRAAFGLYGNYLHDIELVEEWRGLIREKV